MAATWWQFSRLAASPPFYLSPSLLLLYSKLHIYLGSTQTLWRQLFEIPNEKYIFETKISFESIYLFGLYNVLKYLSCLVVINMIFLILLKPFLSLSLCKSWPQRDLYGTMDSMEFPQNQLIIKVDSVIAGNWYL